MSKERPEVNIFESELVPRHEILGEEEKARLLEQFHITPKQLPRIKLDDAVVKSIGAKKDDIIRIVRNSPVGGEYFYYRLVTGEHKKKA